MTDNEPETVDPYRVDPAGVDEEMKRIQWVNWTTEGDEGKVPKRPNNPGVKARSNDATTWGGFDEAIDNADGADLGIGLPLDQAIPFVAIDIDVPTGESDEWVPDLDRLGGAVVEHSPSGKGNKRVYLRDIEVPEWWSNQSGDGKDAREVKLFVDSGYVSVTGDALDGHGPPIGETSQAAFATFLKESWRAFNPDSDELTEPWRDDAVADKTTEAIEDTSASGSGADSDEWVDEDVARDALEHIDPDITHDDWVGIGYALADIDGIGNATAKSLFVKWSRQGSKWDDSAQSEANAIFSGDSGSNKTATVRTLIYHAKRGGWDASEAAREAVGGGGGDSENSELDEWALVRMTLENKRKNNGPAYASAASLLLDSHPTLTERETSRTLVYDDETGVYIENGKVDLRNELVDQLHQAFRTNREREILTHVAGKTATPADDIGGPANLLCTPEGVVDLADLDAIDKRDHDPKYGFRRSTATPFDPDADCPEFRAFVADVVHPDDLDALQELAGYTLMHWGQPFKKAGVLLGPTDAGKSTFLDVLTGILGEDNVSTEGLDTLVNTRWGIAQTYRKWANITNELGTDDLTKLDQFNTITGGDRLVTGEYKGRKKFRFHPTAKHLFAANDLPTIDASIGPNTEDAFFNRLLFVRFPNTVPDEKQVAGLDRTLIENEAPGILNWMLEGLRRLVENGGFSAERTTDEKRAIWEGRDTTVDRFIDKLEVTGDRDDWVPKSTLWRDYANECMANSETPKPEQTFKEEIGSLDGVESTKRTVRETGNRVYAFVGVRRSAFEAPDGETETESESRKDQLFGDGPDGMRRLSGGESD